MAAVAADAGAEAEQPVGSSLIEETIAATTTRAHYALVSCAHAEATTIRSGQSRGNGEPCRCRCSFRVFIIVLGSARFGAAAKHS